MGFTPLTDPLLLTCDFQGAFLEPTILLNVDTKSSAYQEEIFGPVIIVNTFEDEADALAEANCVEFGLFCEAFVHPPVRYPMYKADNDNR